MPILLNTLLCQAGLEFRQTRLLRHQDPTSTKGRTLYKLWRDQRPAFELYQSHQDTRQRATLQPASHWVSFVVTPATETLLAGIYVAQYHGLLENDTPKPHNDEIDSAGSCDVYELTPLPEFAEFEGRLVVDWGPGTRAWIQRADLQNKPVLELKRDAHQDPPFPGFLNLITRLSEITTLPVSWIQALRSSKGIYLLSCPRTKEQYVGKASSIDGFYGRWTNYVETGHGGNVALKSRDASDYQVCILEVAGSAATDQQINDMETLWKNRLQSRDMGLNRN